MTAAGTEIHSIAGSEKRQSRRRFEVSEEFNIRCEDGTQFALAADSLYSSTPQTRGGAVWQLVGLITRRSQVQILSPQPNIATNYSKPLTFRGFCFFVVATFSALVRQTVVSDQRFLNFGFSIRSQASESLLPESLFSKSQVMLEGFLIPSTVSCADTT